MRVAPGSALAGKRLADLPANVDGVSLIAIERGATIVSPEPETILQPDDILLVDVEMSDTEADELWRSLGLEPRRLAETRDYFSDHSQTIGMAEVILPAESQFIGQTVRDADFRSHLGLQVIGLRHGIDDR